MEWLTSASEAITTLVESTISMVTGNTILAVLFAAGTILPVGFKIFKKLKGVAR